MSGTLSRSSHDNKRQDNLGANCSGHQSSQTMGLAADGTARLPFACVRYLKVVASATDAASVVAEN